MVKFRGENPEDACTERSNGAVILMIGADGRVIVDLRS
jgi:hypothetical protein